ncbi:DUF4921 family protein [Tessaracoccus rhinocerotis]|uniref:DUF4921 family protein n=1 Tax=Tessaracoccus rhinocerotis TaxID=1689449 RepID=A0A553K0D3_9ACTN|nr:DUF4921 family protein [Tessaracoccus rhinocerotis]TRY18164.1 DUF4921 family protein [Tessaracoccus rhinocerotis]
MAEPIQILPDGTIKQVNPFSGTQVWTVPGRGHRPLGAPGGRDRPIEPERAGRHCAFCELRYLDTPPEKARMVRNETGWERIDAVAANRLYETSAEFRRVPNLFEILSLDYWEDNHKHRMPTRIRLRMQEYLDAPEGREHVLRVARLKAEAYGVDDAGWELLSEAERLDYVDNFFDGGHDVIIARRHYVDGATNESQLASSGALTPEEHAQFVRFTIWAMADLYRFDRNVLYVSAFQNWLRPAGASFDHLHKQLVAIDERGIRAEEELARLRTRPNFYNEMAVDKAQEYGLLLAENEHAVAFAGFGHRFPTLEVFSKSPSTVPWEHTTEEVRGMSDLLHACHAATGSEIPTNEEWYHQPRDVYVAMPWRVLLKWRVSTVAGFEGGTKINVNTISPFALRERVLPRLEHLRSDGAIAAMRLGDECNGPRNRLRYLG